tara:strand:+ start:94083 stop:94205 length:123 start_codon:yes stop_codon:yes gene_type:complete
MKKMPYGAFLKSGNKFTTKHAGMAEAKEKITYRYAYRKIL